MRADSALEPKRRNWSTFQPSPTYLVHRLWRDPARASRRVDAFCSVFPYSDEFCRGMVRASAATTGGVTSAGLLVVTGQLAMARNGLLRPTCATTSARPSRTDAVALPASEPHPVRTLAKETEPTELCGVVSG